MAKVLRYKQLNERSRELVDGIQTERRAKKVSGGLGGGWSAAAVPLAFHVPVAGAIFGAGALVMGGYYKLFSAISRKNTNELAKELLKNGHAKKNDIILVNKSNVHIIKFSFKHFIYIGIELIFTKIMIFYHIFNPQFNSISRNP